MSFHCVLQANKDIGPTQHNSLEKWKKSNDINLGVRNMRDQTAACKQHLLKLDGKYSDRVQLPAKAD